VWVQVPPPAPTLTACAATSCEPLAWFLLIRPIRPIRLTRPTRPTRPSPRPTAAGAARPRPAPKGSPPSGLPLSRCAGSTAFRPFPLGKEMVSAGSALDQPGFATPHPAPFFQTGRRPRPTRTWQPGTRNLSPPSLSQRAITLTVAFGCSLSHNCSPQVGS
jgi:hypothetical protein